MTYSTSSVSVHNIAENVIHPVDVNRKISLREFVNMFRAGIINDDIDCQRQYIWKEKEQQQPFWTTFLNKEHIPHIYVNETLDANGTIEILDGKQRLTTLYKIVNNEIGYKKNTCDKHYLQLFGEKQPSLYFKDLDVEMQKDLLDNTFIYCVVYQGLNDIEKSHLFGNLNNGTVLSKFQKKIGDNLYYRTCYADKILKNTEELQNVYSSSIISKDQLESYLIGLYFLMKAYDMNGELTPVDICDEYMFTAKNPYWEHFTQNDKFNPEYGVMLADFDEKSNFINECIEKLSEGVQNEIFSKRAVYKRQIVFPLLLTYIDYTNTGIVDDEKLFDYHKQFLAIKSKEMFMGGKVPAQPFSEKGVEQIFEFIKSRFL